MSSCDGFTTSVDKLEVFLSEWTKYIEDFSLKENPSDTDKWCLKQENDYLKERLASLQRSLDFQKEELDSISDYNEKLEQLVRQKDALLTDSSRDVPMERMHNVHSLLLYHKNNLQLWRQDIEALRNCFTTSLQNVHKYLFHQLYALVESFNGQHVQCLRQSQENRRLRRYIQEWKGNIRVVARIRPSHSEKEYNTCFRYIGDDMITCQPMDSNPLSFTFDQVFPPHLPQEFLYEELEPIIASIVDGFHACVVAYGPTGSGKTYTVFGPDGTSGVMELAIRTLLALMEEHKEMSLVPTISMLEIYNETVRDLLSEDPLASLEVREDTTTGNVFAQGAVEMEFTSCSDALRIIQSGLDFRSTSATLLNISSSRSHLLCILQLRGGDENMGCLYVADLAGSERVTHSHVQADVFSALRNKQAHVPYRNSRLTFLLRPALSKTGKAMLIVHVSPEEQELSESIQTLRLGQRARDIELRPSKSQDSTNILLRRQISFLRQQLAYERSGSK